MRTFSLDNARCLKKKIKMETIRRMDLCKFSNKTGKTENYFVGLIVIRKAWDIKVKTGQYSTTYTREITKQNSKWTIKSVEPMLTTVYGPSEEKSETTNVFLLD
jgi:hypothetical protein